MGKLKVDIVTLGCSKNLVDSERLMQQFADHNITIRHNPEDDTTVSPIIIINTCGFIGDAKEESINTILQYAALKSEGKVDKIIVMGCLSERYRKELPAELPEVDAWYGAREFDSVIRELGAEPDRRKDAERYLTTPSHYAYLKISEGCDRRCSYCAIPFIRGAHKSVPMEQLVAEAEALGADAIVNIRYASSAIMQGAAEVIAYGTAVKFK